MYPAPGEGTSCAPADPPDCGVPRDVTLQLRLNRYLLPATAVRQAVTLYAGRPDNLVFLEPEYDVLERVLLYRLRESDGFLAPGLLYTVELKIPVEAGDEGLRAFDGAPLAEGPVPQKFHFYTARIEPTRTNRGGIEPEPAPACGVLEIFERGGCQGSDCHDAEERRMGLSLVSAQSLFTTAINRVAHQTAIGPGGAPLEEPVRLGVQMPIIDPGRPDNSYMMYKLIRRDETFADRCDSRYRAPSAGQCLAPPPDENARLREWFVRGHPMPFVPPAQPFSYDDLRVLQRWIAEGAPLEALQGCR